MNTEPATAEMIDALASIEMQRQEREKESGVPVSCSWALGKLYEVLPRKRKSPEMKAESAALQANIEAATQAIERLRKLAQITGQQTKLKSDRPWHQQKSWRDAQKTFAGNRPRRTMNHQES
jgi:hypothetical protein